MRSLPALARGADPYVIAERVNVLIRDYNTLRGAPAGCVMPFAGAAAPDGWLLCFGQAISRTTYAALFAAIGTAYGAGDGSTTFNLPDLGGRVVAGKESSASRLTSAISGVDGATLGASGGDERMHQHNHGVTDPGHAHSSDIGGGTVFATFTNGSGFVITVAAGVDRTMFFSGQTAVSGTGISTQNAGAGGAQNVQPTIVLNYIIAT